MSLFTSIFRKKEEVITSNAGFWKWFVKNEKKFHKAVKKHTNIDKNFLAVLEPKIAQLKGEIWFLAGMFDSQTAELILTADGSLKNIAFVEDLMKEAPLLKNWKLTCLKQPSESNRFSLNMNGYSFDETTMSFYPINHPNHPDEIDIIITHKDLNEKNEHEITTGVYLSLDNTLGEINSVSTIDNLTIIHPDNAEQELISLEKLPSFLIWREKEFIEQYEGIRIKTEDDNYLTFEGTTTNNLPIIATINSDLIKWDKKASHPWIGTVLLKYDGNDNNGMPDISTYNLMNQIEDELLLLLKDSEGYLNIGRETANNLREVYFACVDFRKPSKAFFELQQKYSDLINFDSEIYRDKYWKSLDRFAQLHNDY